MKKILSLLLVVALLSAGAVAVFSGCNLFKSITLEEAQSNLEEAGYAVTVMTGTEYVQTEDAFPFVSSFDLDYYLYAVKGSEEIHLLFYCTVDAASEDYDFITPPKGLSFGQSNKVLYLATKQAKSDAKI